MKTYCAFINCGGIRQQVIVHANNKREALAELKKSFPEVKMKDIFGAMK